MLHHQRWPGLPKEVKGLQIQVLYYGHPRDKIHSRQQARYRKKCTQIGKKLHLIFPSLKELRLLIRYKHQIIIRSNLNITSHHSNSHLSLIISTMVIIIMINRLTPNNSRISSSSSNNTSLSQVSTNEASTIRVKTRTQITITTTAI